jgi:hypothetical protein
MLVRTHRDHLEPAMNPMHPTHRPATPLRTILLIAAGVVVAVLVLAAALSGSGGDAGEESSTDSGCTTEFFDSGSITSCGGEIVSTDTGTGY